MILYKDLYYFYNMYFICFASILLASSSWTYLHYNENNRGPSEKVKAVIQETISDTHRYPDQEQKALVQQIAAYHFVREDQVLLANGLSSILCDVAEIFTGERKNLITAYPTYGYLSRLAQSQGATVTQIPLRSEDYAYDLNKMLEVIDDSTSIIYICNPNNPTGSITPRNEIDDFLDKLPAHVYVFIDEAYHHFATEMEGYTSFIDKPFPNDRVIVGRSFSKAYGLSGLRLGYVIASPCVIAALKKKECYARNNIYALRAASMALQDEEGLHNTIVLNAEARCEFYRQLEMRKLKCIPSHTNFVMLETAGRSVDALIDHYNNHHIKIGRKFMDTHIRVTLGLPHEMAAFWYVWDTFID